MAEPKHHIVLLPFMAQGHLIPFLALANQILQKYDFNITIASTPLNIHYLGTAMAANSQSFNQNIHLCQLPFNSADHGLPPGTENTEALPLNQIIKLFHSSTALKIPLQNLVEDIKEKEGNPPLCIVSDVFLGWANDVARSCGTVNVVFTTGGAYGTAAYASLWQNLPHRKTEGDYFSLPGFPDSHRFHVTQLHRFLRSADGTDPWSAFFQTQIRHSLESFGMLCNTAEEIEPFGLNILKNYTKLPVWCIGPLLPPNMIKNESNRKIEQHTGRKSAVPVENCLGWLDLHPDRSVLYISFGSQNTISPSQMIALAAGLEDSKTPFIWVIRPPAGFNLREEFRSEWLPDGFEDRVSKTNLGLIVHGWAPQLEILCHKSTGAFLSHCGWNSVVESLSQGVPIIGWPLAAEQGYNAKMLVEEMEVCVELTRGLDSAISKEEVIAVVRMVVGGGGKGDEMRKKAGEIGELIKRAMNEDGSSFRAMDQFVSTLLNLGRNGV